VVKILVTGGAGFIGSALARYCVRHGHDVVNVDKLTYAAAPEALVTVAHSPRYTLIQADIGDARTLHSVFARHQPDAVVNLAAETHVDRSITGPAVFVQTNVLGTAVLLGAAQAYFAELNGKQREGFRYLQVSTDEVFGSLGPNDPPFTEVCAYAPRSPYAASKAAADHMVRAWGHTYGLPVLISHGSNTYGPWQFPEKLIPLMLAKACEGEPMPIYGDGLQVRDWLHVDDHAAALASILKLGEPGQSYVVGSRSERTNRAVVQEICRLLDARRPAGAPHERFMVSVTDRPGHDQRYALNPSKLEAHTGWKPAWQFEHGLAETVDWYLAHRDWWLSRAHQSSLSPRRAAQ
jgi:dTDP-glucose 4,6-dehydratase